MCGFLSQSAAWGQVIPPAGFLPLNQIPVPQPPNLSTFVKNVPAAIKLGKALFWDMQAGSDGVQACGTCHFKAGADPRLKNQLSPGLKAAPVDNLFGNNFLGVPGFTQFAPNYTLQPADFPFHQRQAPADQQFSPILRDTNDVVSSQGVRFSQFVAITPNSAVDTTTPIFDATFNMDYPAAVSAAKNTRRVEPRNTPTVINAVFNFANFWDGRANNIFNGASPFGPLDPGARIWVNNSGIPGGIVSQQTVSIPNASLASQAVGPPLSEFEMSALGRTFPDVGRKLLNNGLTPLGKQLVHPGDSVLGPSSLAAIQPNGTIAGGKGLNTTYTEMIQSAFVDKFWTGGNTPAGFTQMEANFSLFWGLAVQLYEATLVSDQTRFDSWLASGGTNTALTPTEQQGFQLFTGIANCELCHIGTEFTAASAGNIGFLNNAINGTMEVMFVADGTQVIYDEGFNNTGVRPTTDDPGRGGTTPNTMLNSVTGLPFPLSFSRLAELQAQTPTTQLPFESPLLPLGPNGLPVAATFPVNADGSFKVPGLRNVELTAPFFHNGSVMTLEDVVDFYAREGNFPSVNKANLDPLISQGIFALQSVNDPGGAKKAAVVAFMKSLTDPRVAAESAPFDHPEILVPEGEPEVLTRIPATNAQGVAPTTTLLLNAVATPTNVDSLIISGTMQAGLSPVVTVNTAAIAGPVTVAGTDWSAPISGLREGANTITVSVVNLGVLTTASLTVTLDTLPPALTIDTVSTVTRLGSQTISGTVEAGLRPTITLSPAATIGPISVTGANWSAQLSGLTAGVSNLTVTATDAAGNVAVKTAAIAVVVPDGSFRGGPVTVLDALKALQIAVGTITPTPIELMHGDVAPLGAPDGAINIIDALLILKKGIGLINF